MYKFDLFIYCFDKDIMLELEAFMYQILQLYMVVRFSWYDLAKMNIFSLFNICIEIIPHQHNTGLFWPL